MQRVPVRELNQDTAGVLARVQRGEALEVTLNGRPIARLLPTAEHPLTTLFGEGVVRPARRALEVTVSAADLAAAGGDPFGGLAGVVAEDRRDRM